MIVGTFAGIVFYVTEQTVRTLDNLTLETSARYSTHQRHNNIDLPEKTGVELQTASFEMLLSSYLGVNPMTLYRTMQNIITKGRKSSLVLGMRRIGTQWTMKSAKLESQQFDGQGNVTVAKVTVSLQEYPRK